MKENRIEGNPAQKKPKSRLRENVEAIVVAVLLAMFIRTFVVQAFKIPSGSMKETLQIGDHILVNKFIYGIRMPFLKTMLIPVKEPQKNDIVVFEFPEDPEKDFIKRVVGVAGDVIEIRNKQLFVNGELQQEEFSIHSDPVTFPPRVQPRDFLGPVTVPSNSLFVMGDNRDHSYDSRYWGFVNLKAVKGKAFMIYWSWDKENVSIRLNRIFSLLK